MKQPTCLIFCCLFLLSMSGEVNGQSISLLFDSETILIAASKSYSEAIPIEKCKEHPDPVYQLLYAYYFPTSIETYKSIFHKEKYPSGIENNYDVWRASMNDVEIKITSQFSALYRNYTTRILNYTYKKSGTILRLSFFAKQIEGKWYPYEATEYMEMNALHFFFPIINPDVIDAMIHAGDVTPAAEVAKDIMKVCAAADRKLSAACVYATAEQWGIGGDTKMRAKEDLLFQRRIQQQGMRAALIPAEAITQALPENRIAPEEAKIINYYLQKGETMIAFSRLQIHYPEMTFEQINESLTKIPGFQGLETKTIEHK